MERANSTQPKKFYGLDHLRALAIIMVFSFHYCIISNGEPSWLNNISQLGWTGVDLFFVLSGFLISSQLFEEIKRTGGFSYKTFFLKRCFRILPAYWTVLAIYFCFPAFHEREALSPLWKFLTFTQNFGLNLKNEGTFSHAWSLCVEEHFYFFLPLTLLLLLRFPKFFKKCFWFLPVLFILGIFIRYYSFQHFYAPNAGSPGAGYLWYQYIYYPTWCRLDSLLIGVTIAAIYCFFPAAWNRIAKLGNWLFLFTSIVFIIAWYYLSNPGSLWASVLGFSLVALGWGFLVAASISPKSILYKWKSRTTAFIAAISYAVYLSHKGIIHLTSLWLEKEIHSGALFFISVLTSLVAAYLLHLAIEKPFMRWRQKIIKPESRSTRSLSLKMFKAESCKTLS
jgi:peptidoglycan/LPS O-acetylase OafA/YrhL